MTEKILRVGAVLHGCGESSWTSSVCVRVEAIGYDWVVVRSIRNPNYSKPFLVQQAEGNDECITQYLKDVEDCYECYKPD